MPGMESHVALNPGTWPLSMHLAPLFELHSSLTGWFLGSVQKGKTDQGGFRKGKDQADKRVKSGMGGGVALRYHRGSRRSGTRNDR